MNTVFRFMAAFLLTLTIAGAANAAEPRLVGTFGEWSAYVFMEDGSKVCYMASKPQKQEGDYAKRGEVFALVTRRPTEGSKDVFSYIAGYSYKPGSDASVEVAGETFTLFTQDDTAWAPDADTDKGLTDAIQKGTDMVIRGVSGRGTKTKDVFSLKGSSKAYEKIAEECKM